MKGKRNRSWVSLSAPRWRAYRVVRNWKGRLLKRLMRALLCLCFVFPIGVTANESLSNIFVFGNNLSDTGNAAAGRNFIAGVEVNLCHPVDLIVGCGDLFFQETRVSNGRVAVEVPADRLGFGELQPSLHPLFFATSGMVPIDGDNFAVAGATARGPSVIDLPSQVLGFLISHPLAPSNALYVVFIGGNDVIDAVQALLAALAGLPSASVETSEDIIAAAVDAIGDNINLLIGAGARKFLVVNSPNIGSVPAIKIAAEEAGVPPALLRGLASFLTIKFNEQLAARLDQIRAEQREIGNSVKIKEFNLFRFFEGVRFVFRLFGLNTVDACFDSETYLKTGVRIFHPDCEPDQPGDAPKFDRFVFFDDLHPTGRVHAVVGKGLTAAARKLVRKLVDD